MNPTIYSISQIFVYKGVSNVVHSPGSRNAPLTISFARNPSIKMYSIVDERSAGFIALGMSLKLRKPIILCCTSGTSLLNYAPAVAEAYYQQVPLIVISADRPPEWLDQRDGQTINQPNALANFVKKAYQLPVDLSHPDSQWELNYKLNEAVNTARSGSLGPVHINIPFREPFYPVKGEDLSFGKPRIFDLELPPTTTQWDSLIKRWHLFKKRLIVAGQSTYEDSLKQLETIKNHVLIADVISNIPGNQSIRHHDLFLGNLTNEEAGSLRPELLITFGKSVISKNLKIYLRKHPPKEHWHFDAAGFQIDTYQSVSTIVKGSFIGLMQALPSEESDDFSKQLVANYNQSWQVLEKRTKKSLQAEILTCEFSDIQAYHAVMKAIPTTIDLHLANSMSVRYANLFQGLKDKVVVYCNRGTSGIDGTNGTAVGNAIVGDKPVLLLTGDLSFFYDRNAFFHSHNISKLKVIVFNNSGGGIFRLIKGPVDQPELEDYFETRHAHSASFTAAEYGFDYYVAHELKSLEAGLLSIFKNNKTPQLLEVFTNPLTNQEVFQLIKSKL